MPKNPIQFRETFFENVRGPNSQPVMRHLEWNRVDTELGPMVEPRSLAGFAVGPVVQVDVTDASYSKVSIMDSNRFYAEFGTDGSQIPVNFNA